MDTKEIKDRFDNKSQSFLLNTLLGQDILYLRDNKDKDIVYKFYKKWESKCRGKMFLILLEKYCSLSL